MVTRESAVERACTVDLATASGPGEYHREAYEGHRVQNPYVSQVLRRALGGYVRCDVTPEQWRTEMKLADSIEDPASPVRTFASFVVEDGQPGAERA